MNDSRVSQLASLMDVGQFRPIILVQTI